MAVIISTRNRGDRITATIRGILASDYTDFTLMVVDQSDNGTTEQAVRSFRNSSRIQYVRSTTEGLSIGRNVGINSTKSELIAITDDDCEVPAQWLRRLVAALADDQRIGLVFGSVLPAAHDPTMGFIPSRVCRAHTVARSIYEKHRIQGMGACMGMRRSVWERLGGFDPTFGAGALFRAAEETDLTLRALLAGYSVCDTPEVAVVHHGFYGWGERRGLVDGYWYGTGAAFGKNFRYHPPPIAYLLCGLAFRWLLDRPGVASSLGSRPHRLLQLTSFCRGFIAGTLAVVDPGRRHEADGRVRREPTS